jgi:predicted enzyme related to lactoylglutathione lyase
MRAFWTTAAAALMTTALAGEQAPAPSATPGLATGTCNFSPVVADLDRAVDFYEKALGLQFTAADAPTRKFDAATPLVDIHGVKGGAMRWASARPPGSRCGIELVEFAKVNRTPVQPRPQDPGATTLILMVRDIAPAFARAKQAGATIVSSGGAVIPLANGRGGAVLVKDLYGH